jgi:hypothetical protein
MRLHKRQQKWSTENRYITMQITEYNVPGLCGGEIKIADMTRHQRLLVCIACDESREKLMIEFEDEYLAERFADAVEAGTAERPASYELWRLGIRTLPFRSSDKKRRTKGYDDSCESH